jgi:hypothetical protein
MIVSMELRWHFTIGTHFPRHQAETSTAAHKFRKHHEGENPLMLGDRVVSDIYEQLY